jgi:hypothetical protein
MRTAPGSRHGAIVEAGLPVRAAPARWVRERAAKRRAERHADWTRGRKCGRLPGADAAPWSRRACLPAWRSRGGDLQGPRKCARNGARNGARIGHAGANANGSRELTRCHGRDGPTCPRGARAAGVTGRAESRAERRADWTRGRKCGRLPGANAVPWSRRAYLPAWRSRGGGDRARGMARGIARGTARGTARGRKCGRLPNVHAAVWSRRACLPAWRSRGGG